MRDLSPKVGDKTGKCMSPTEISVLRNAYIIAASRSDDLRTQTGAVLLDPQGFKIGESANVFPRGVSVTAERQDNAVKKNFIIHAEQGAILAAARNGYQTKGGVLYSPWSACVDCARAIIQAGIIRLVGHQQMLDKTPERWQASLALAGAMLDEAGVTRVYHDGPVDGMRILFDGEIWQP
jgi:dCMP deaminase